MTIEETQLMQEALFREHLLARLGEIATGQVDLARAIEALALAASKSGRAGTLRVKIEAPPTKLRGRRRRLKKALASTGGNP